MAAQVTKGPDTDAQITYEDQQQINSFARNNAKLQDVKEELASQKKELQNLEDAGDEIMLLDDEESIPYRVGEVFMSCSSEETAAMLEQAKEAMQADIERLDKKSDEYKQVLQDLKVKLYAKFGNNINLENEED